MPRRANKAPLSESKSSESRRWSPGIAAVLSFLLPGLGQLDKGQIVRGLLLMIFVGLGYLLIFPGLAVQHGAIVDANSTDPNPTANSKRTPAKYRWLIVLICVVLSVYIPILSGWILSGG